ncbi:DNA polymerase III subunit psi [Pasteurella sp. PK-2025]|uniref:DNA polymerase III subunit psi n=1 Tax=Pasteurella sp. PK-2025 TaxID=3413133 RepID=UPI003C71781A
MNRRDLLLQKMGITQWQLKHPERLKGMVNIAVDPEIRLIIISDDPIQAHAPLLKDILCSLQLTLTQYLHVSFQQAQYLKLSHPLNYWLLSQNTEKIDRTLALCQQANAIWQSPEWTAFQQSHQAKRQLWQQIQTSPAC